MPSGNNMQRNSFQKYPFPGKLQMADRHTCSIQRKTKTGNRGNLKFHVPVLWCFKFQAENSASRKRWI